MGVFMAGVGVGEALDPAPVMSVESVVCAGEARVHKSSSARCQRATVGPLPRRPKGGGDATISRPRRSGASAGTRLSETQPGDTGLRLGRLCDDA